MGEVNKVVLMRRVGHGLDHSMSHGIASVVLLFSHASRLCMVRVQSLPSLSDMVGHLG